MARALADFEPCRNVTGHWAVCTICHPMALTNLHVLGWADRTAFEQLL